MNKNQKIAEIAAHLIESGHLKEATLILETITTEEPTSDSQESTEASQKPKKATVKEAAGRSLYDYMLDMESTFLKDVAKGIKKVARSHAEKIEVHRGRSVVWLQYTGQDRSDLDMDLTISIVSTSLKNNQAQIHFQGKKVISGDFDETLSEALGYITPQRVVDKFSEYFGIY